MRNHRGLLGWGVFLLVVGAVQLAVRAGYVTDDQVRNVGSLWPLILIGIGIGILLARTRLAVLGGLLAAATFGLIVGGLLSVGIAGLGVSACGPGSNAVAFPARTGGLTATTATVDIDLNCGDVTVSTSEGNEWRVDGEDRDGSGPTIEAGDDSLRVRSTDSDRGPLTVVGEHETWRITLPDAVRLDLGTKLNAGNSSVNLAGASIKTLVFNLNAGSAVLDLGSAEDVGDVEIGLNAASLNLTLPNQSLTGSIEANAGSVNLCAPPGAGLKLNTSESIVASYDYEDHGLVKNGSTWQTPGFETAAVRIELDTHANAGSFTLDSEDGCHG